jgi:hypothetical protein
VARLLAVRAILGTVTTEGTDDRSGTLFVLEEEPPSDRRWYCHWDGVSAPGFDSVDEAVAWGLERARGVVVRTVRTAFYLAGEAPEGWDPGGGYRSWPPSDIERRQIDADFQASTDAGAQEQARWLAYQAARDEWLAHAAPGQGTQLCHESTITSPGSEDVIWFEELDDTGQLCAGCGSDGVFGFGTTSEVVTSVTGRSADDPWIAAVTAALDRERTWAHGRRSALEVRMAGGDMFHVSAAANRASIERHGLDWRLMTRPGVAGSREPELDGIFVCESEGEVDFFTEMARVPSDVWAVDVSRRWVESGTTGWLIVPEPLPAGAVRLVRRGVVSSRWERARMR